MNLNTIYRFYPGDHNRSRPTNFSKINSLKSFLIAWRNIGEKRGRLIVAVDSNSCEKTVTQLLTDACAEVRFLGGLGNSKSYWKSAQWIKEFPKDSLVYYAEDDYLYLPFALEQLIIAAEKIPSASYFSLYDHLDRYTRGDDWNKNHTNIFLAGNRHWQTIESTCMSFGARVSDMQKDLIFHRIVTMWWLIPKDRWLWRMVQGLGLFKLFRFKKHKLISPIPSLATHQDAAFMAPLIDWKALDNDL